MTFISPYLYPGLKGKKRMYSFEKIMIKAKLTFHENDYMSKHSNIQNSDVKHIIIYFLKRKTKMTLQAIGDEFGLTHAAVIHAIRKVEKMKNTDLFIRSKIRIFEKALNDE